MRAALRSEDGRDEATVLTELLSGTGVKETSFRSPHAIWIARGSCLSKYVFQAAGEFGGDLALQILQEEAYALADMADRSAKAEPVISKVAARGGCFKNGIYLFSSKHCLGILSRVDARSAQGLLLRCGFTDQQHFLKGTGSDRRRASQNRMDKSLTKNIDTWSAESRFGDEC